jgi:hypothetical protein
MYECMSRHGQLIGMQSVKKFKVGKAPGIDGNVPKVLVECANVLCKPLSIIDNFSLQTGRVPTDWKRANVTAIFKKGSKEVAGFNSS